MSTGPTFTSKNHLLAALPEKQYQRLAPHLEPFTFKHAKVLCEINEPIKYCYFPSEAVISLVTQLEDGRIVEVALVGNEGMTGLAFLLGQKVSAERAIVQIPDGGVRVKAEVILKQFMRCEALHAVILRYINSLIRQVAQTAVCNASHTIEERLSRWLLMCHDRVESDQINLTQEYIAEMLGTRRATVNVGAINLQSAGFIKYNRGRIQIIDRVGMEGFACECYEAVRRVSEDGNKQALSKSG
jgi:CRP-like cAMP-binding protein